MKTVKVLSLKNQSYLSDRCLVAESFSSRLKGLIGCKSLELGQGLLLRPCNDIHMWFMKISIDVVFIKRQVDETGEECFLVTSVRKNLKPWKLLPVRDGRASETLELPVGVIERCNVSAGDLLCLS